MFAMRMQILFSFMHTICLLFTMVIEPKRDDAGRYILKKKNRKMQCGRRYI